MTGITLPLHEKYFSLLIPTLFFLYLQLKNSHLKNLKLIVIEFLILLVDLLDFLFNKESYLIFNKNSGKLSLGKIHFFWKMNDKNYF